jgi:hypothetical protein
MENNANIQEDRVIEDYPETRIKVKDRDLVELSLLHEFDIDTFFNVSNLLLKRLLCF